MKRKLLKTLKILGFIAITLVTLVALALAIENYRGKRAWEACRAELAARGEVLDWAALVPPPVPDDQNFWKTPVLLPLTDLVVDPATGFRRLRDTNAPAAISRLFSGFDSTAGLNLGSWRLGQATDLGAMQTALRRETNPSHPDLKRLLATPPGLPYADVLALIAVQAAPLEEVRTALTRPYARIGFPVEQGGGGLLEPLGPLKQFARAFQRRAVANLAAGNVDAAASDVMAGLRLAQTLESEPILIATLVEYAAFEAAIQPLWEGLARRQWQEPQLRALEAELARFNFVAGLARTYRFERAYALALLDGWRRRPAQQDAADADAAQAFNVGPSRFPSGWICLTQVGFTRLYQDLLLPVLDTNRVVIDAPRADGLLKQANAQFAGWQPYHTLVRALVPAVARVWQKGAQAQTTVNLARIAIGLERFRQTEGSFPERLDELAPRFLARVPLDVVVGQPHHYRRETPDRYVLYSVGLNLKDDGAHVAVTKTGQPNVSAIEGDWVWWSGLRETAASEAPAGK